jgi:putative RecB family exonuclease
MAEPLFRITHSKAQSFLRCRKQYWFGYVSGEQWPEEEAEPAPLVIGNAVHRGMQELCESGDPDVARQRVDAYLRMPKHAAAAPGTEEYAVVMECLERGIEAHQSIDSAERWAELETWAPAPKAGISVLAKIDRVDRLRDGLVQIIDWKTGRYDDPYITDEQLDIGHVAVRVVHRLKPDEAVRAIGWNLRSGSKRVRELVRDDAAATVRRMVGLARRMQQEQEFTATPGPQCGWCRWRDRCPEAAEVESGEWEDDLLAEVDYVE